MIELLLALSLVCAVTALGLAVTTRRAVRGPGQADDVPHDLAGLQAEVAALKRHDTAALSRVALVRYDAFGDMGGQMSWSLAALDRSGDGVLITSIIGRSEARTYAKSVAGGDCDQALSPEEQRALAQALNRA